MNLIRQGDVTLRRTGPAPVTVPGHTVQLASGDTSAHVHTILGVEERTADGRRILVVPVEAQLTCSDPTRHAPILVPAGTYQVLGQARADGSWVGQRQYTPEGVMEAGD